MAKYMDKQLKGGVIYLDHGLRDFGPWLAGFTALGLRQGGT
jgi:hypothetical protein